MSETAPDPSRDALVRAGPPHAIDLFAFAAISADLAEGDEALGEVLRRRGLTEEQWTEATVFWTRRMAEDARPDASGNLAPRVASTFSDAFTRAQDRKRPVVPLSAGAWAALVHAIDVDGLGPALARRDLRLADHARLVRHWAKALATDPARAEEYEAALVALRTSA